MTRAGQKIMCCWSRVFNELRREATRIEVRQPSTETRNGDARKKKAVAETATAFLINRLVCELSF